MVVLIASIFIKRKHQLFPIHPYSILTLFGIHLRYFEIDRMNNRVILRVATRFYYINGREDLFLGGRWEFDVSTRAESERGKPTW